MNSGPKESIDHRETCGQAYIPAETKARSISAAELQMVI